jgi:hypothetical protein
MTRIESTLGDVVGQGHNSNPGRGGIHTVNERRVIIAAGAGLVTFAGTKYGVLKQIPGIGPVPAAVVTIALGVALAAYVEKAGTVGALIEGVGYGLVAIGALELAGA